ncbi:MAG: dioxygenase [Rhodoferax sp.]|nr:dioxygenase [Rhodoferax sp.]
MQGSVLGQFHLAPGAAHHPRFQGLPDELQQMQYPAKGHPELARRSAALIRSCAAIVTDKWGLDPGTWAVLHHLYPYATVPVFQVSIDYDKPATFHHAVGRELAALSEMGVLVVGSDNLVHNLRATEDLPDGLAALRPCAQNFDRAVKSARADGEGVRSRDHCAHAKSHPDANPTTGHRDRPAPPMGGYMPATWCIPGKAAYTSGWRCTRRSPAGSWRTIPTCRLANRSGRIDSSRSANMRGVRWIRTSASCFAVLTAESASAAITPNGPMRLCESASTSSARGWRRRRRTTWGIGTCWRFWAGRICCPDA